MSRGVANIPVSEKLAVSFPEAGALLDVCEHTIRRWVKDGKLPSHREGRRHLIPMYGLREFAKGLGQSKK